MTDDNISETYPAPDKNRQHHTRAYFILLAFTFITFTPLIYKLSTIGGDYVAHLKWASDMEDNGTLMLPHPLYHLLTILTKNILSVNYAIASTIIIVSAIYLLAILNYKVLSRYTSAKTATLVSVCLLVASPLQILAVFDHHFYFGYVGLTIYHSPTMLLLKPLALIAFCYTLKSFTETSGNTLSRGTLLAISIFFCGISKPNFLIIILPALILFLIATQQLKSSLKSAYIYWAFFLPTVFVLSLQFLHTYFYQSLSIETANEESHVLFLPFESMAHYSKYLFIKLILSIAFPLLVLCYYPKEFIKDKALLLASLCLLMGLILTYFFSESGYRMYAGNFWWSGQIGLYLTFLFSAAFLLKNKEAFTTTISNVKKYKRCVILFFAHTAFGALYYFLELCFRYQKFW
ncbi:MULTISPECIES: hypothetical protein [Pseudomonas]|jgi:hypothetical protein|uniref:Glycosyltransferase RgtA/B/C/D-like domain-containing protein n=1 Tax=Pseudomonas protegens (strain DSM 19095 / LMG 27888 / CFBP 6595 / CHA0) TaxID=1124983 RepID=A0A2C9EK13_PSEPH|nr:MULTISPECIES: hypothetical protein [Pseudomonas]AGL83965.1 hypothetical protein PFLCHA0_c21940 [Pseudomonas protegens CHA0]AQT09005.1 hypothetical protein H78_02333 [Pseudomonas protegens]MBB1614578.1 hypothetical protein [Pseudomonas sp. UMC65]MBB1617880.1 hypothetical protein [Pseudomonas sp. UME65]MBP5114011.1 hypothetical protein [Pseudomonas protegens]